MESDLGLGKGFGQLRDCFPMVEKEAKIILGKGGGGKLEQNMFQKNELSWTFENVSFNPTMISLLSWNFKFVLD